MKIGNRILSAFVEVTGDKPSAVGVNKHSFPPPQPTPGPVADDGKFRQHFERLFAESDLPGPDYYKFSKMVEAMTTITDEKAKFVAAFAGLSVQGLGKEKLLNSAGEYLKMVEGDSAAFQQTIAAAMKEKVHSKQQELKEKNRRIQQLSQEITELHKQMALLQNELKVNEEKIRSNREGYLAVAESVKAKLLYDIEKIREHVS